MATEGHVEVTLTFELEPAEAQQLSEMVSSDVPMSIVEMPGELGPIVQKIDVYTSKIEVTA